MNDPQDLLYTNSFINTEIINENEINEQTKTYDRFIKYENEQNTENTNNTIKYINNDDNESDPINIQKTIHQPFPIDNNKNNYPMFDPLLKDISKTVYTKLKDSVINIDAGFRNPIYYPLTSKFKVNLPYTLNNIHQIEIFNINIPNFLKSVNAMQNNFSWQYFSDYYINTDISYNLLPFPDSLNRRFYAYPDIKYSTYKIPFAVLENDQKYDPSNFLTYQTNIQPGNYTLDELIREIEKSAADVLHGNNRNILLQDKDVNKYNVCEEPYNSFPNLKNSTHLWKFEINKQNGAVFCTNRIEEVQLIGCQTFYNNNEPLDPSYFKIYDIFYEYSSLGKDYTLDPKYIYIIVPLFQYKTDQWFDNSANSGDKRIYPSDNYYNPYEVNPFPLVITLDSPNNNNDGEVLKLLSQISMTPFYDLRLYTDPPLDFSYDESEIKNISYYKFSDIITIPGLDNSFVRLGLRWSPVTSKGIPFQNSIPKPDYGYFTPSNNFTSILNKSLSSFLIQNNLLNNIFVASDIGVSAVGRALPCRLIYGKENQKFQNYKKEEVYETKTSILEYFDFSIANSTNGDIRNIFNRGFAFIHSNLYGSKLSQDNPIIQFVESLSFYNTKSIDLGVKISNENFYLKNNNYIYLKLNFDGIDISKIRQNQNQLAFSENQFHVNQNYSNTSLINYLGIGESVNCFAELLEIKNKNYDGIFCKIFTSTIPGDINLLDNNLSSKIIFNAYDNILDSISTVVIEILDSNLRIIETEENFSFDLRFIYSDSKLKETNINTITNKIDLVGKNY